MLDISIFHVDTPIYEGSKKVGAIPCLSLGDYTHLTEEDQRQLDSTTSNLSQESLSIFEKMVRHVGKRFFVASLLLARQETNNSTAKKELNDKIQLLCPGQNPSLTNIQKEKNQIKSIIKNTFSPEQQIKMMIQLKAEYDEQKQNQSTSSQENEILARGIAECVQSLRDIPRDEKSPLIRRLCISGTHRGQILNNYSRS